MNIASSDARSTSRMFRGRHACLLAVPRLLFAVACVVAALGPPAAAQADTCRWTGAAVTDRWTAPANWADCHGGGVPQSGDSVSFANNAARSASVNDIAGLTLQAVTFTGEAVGQQAYLLSGEALSVGALTFDSDVAGARLLAPLSVTSPGVRNQGAAIATLGGPITFASTLNVFTTEPESGLRVDGPVSGEGTLTKYGPGALDLHGAFTGGMDVTDGLVQFNVPSQQAAVMITGGRVGGLGSIGVLYGLIGTVAPGRTTGTASDIGTFTIRSGSLGADTTLAIELAGVTPGGDPDHDQLRVLEHIRLAGATLQLTDRGVGQAPPGTAFVIIENDGTMPVEGTFAGLPEGAFLDVAGVTLRLSYVGGDGNDVVLSTAPWIFTRYFAEGAVNSFFATRIAVLNPDPDPAQVRLRLFGQNGEETTIARTVGARQRTTFELTPGSVPDATFSTIVESDRPVVADRLVTWDGTGYGSTLESSIDSPGRTWYLAEGATGSYSLYYLLQNPGAVPAQVQVTYLLPAPRAPITIPYTVEPRSRFTIDVAGEHPSLAATEVSAKIASTQPIVVERAMYAHLPGQFQAAGHVGAAQPSPASRWFLAEGATGFFDEYVLIANPGSTGTMITATFLPEGQSSFSDTFPVAANSRYTLDLKRDERLRATPVSVIIESSAAPVVVERVMWWPSGQPWYETSLSAGVTQTGTRWAIAEGEVGGPFNSSTYILIANTDPVAAGHATVTLLYEDGTTHVTGVPLPANSRRSVDASALPQSANKRFGVIVESNGIPIVVERSIFSTIPGGGIWTAGATSAATNLTPTP